MTNEDKLKKIIEKAVKGGWKHEYYFINNTPFKSLDGDNIVHENEIIFNHDFLKAYFGDDIIRVTITDGLGIKYQIAMNANSYHAQQLVLEEDRINYLYKAL